MKRRHRFLYGRKLEFKVTRPTICTKIDNFRMIHQCIRWVTRCLFLVSNRIKALTSPNPSTTCKCMHGKGDTRFFSSILLLSADHRKQTFLPSLLITFCKPKLELRAEGLSIGKGGTPGPPFSTQYTHSHVCILFLFSFLFPMYPIWRLITTAVTKKLQSLHLTEKTKWLDAKCVPPLACTNILKVYTVTPFEE